MIKTELSAGNLEHEVPSEEDLLFWYIINSVLGPSTFTYIPFKAKHLRASLPNPRPSPHLPLPFRTGTRATDVCRRADDRG